MAEKQKIEIEIESKLLKQLKVFSKYTNQPIDSLINRIIKKEMIYAMGNNYEHLAELMSEILNYDQLIDDLRKIGEENT